MMAAVLSSICLSRSSKSTSQLLSGCGWGTSGYTTHGHAHTCCSLFLISGCFLNSLSLFSPPLVLSTSSPLSLPSRSLSHPSFLSLSLPLISSPYFPLAPTLPSLCNYVPTHFNLLYPPPLPSQFNNKASIRTWPG